MGRRMLLVDDEPDILQGARIWLSAAGYETQAAYNGDEAVYAAWHDHPDGIVLDVRMPKKDGLTVLAELKQRDDTCNIPIVMLSASLIDRQRALDAGAKFFLTKPYQGKELVAAVNAAVISHG